MKSRTAVIASAVVVMALGVWVTASRSRSAPVAPPQAAVPWSYSRPDGLRRDWEVEATGEGVLDVALASGDAARPAGEQVTGQQGGVKVSTRARLQAKFFADPGGGWNVAARLAGPSRIQNGASAPGADLLQNPFSFHLAPDGAMSRFRFTPGMPSAVSAVPTALATGLQVVLPPGRVSSWTVEERSGDDLRRAAYTVRENNAIPGSLALTKQVLAVTPAGDAKKGETFLSGTRTVVEKFTGEAAIFFGRGVERVSFSEVTSLLAREGLLARMALVYTATGVDPEADPFPPSFAEFEKLVASQRWVEALYRRTDPDLDRVGAKMGIEDALKHFLDLQRNDKRAAERFLVNFLRQKPEMAGKLLQVLDRDREQSRYDESTQLLLWRLVTEAGTPEAQRAVATALLDPAWGRRSHVRALLYAVDFENPGRELVDALWSLYRDPTRNGDRADPGMARNMSLLAIGGVGSREHQNAETRDAVAASLVENLRTSKEDRTEVALTLKAIGNSGNDALLGDVRPYLSAEDEKVRAAACDSLRLMENPEARKLLMSSAERDPAPLVREEALQVIRGNPVDAPTATWARDQVARIPSIREQVLAIEILGKSLPDFPGNEAALRALLAGNPDPLAKETIYRYIAPSPSR